MDSALCNLFRNAAAGVYELVGAGQATRVRAAEETLTNILLIGTTLAHVAGFRIRGFARQEERWTGADWEMWLGTAAGRWLGLRMQAKAIDLPGLGYAHLHYRGQGAPLFQSDALIRASPRCCLLFTSVAFACRG